MPNGSEMAPDGPESRANSGDDFMWQFRAFTQAARYARLPLRLLLRPLNIADLASRRSGNLASADG
jgi:hypothetical protein